jgi:hypothetical protein
MWGAQVMLSNMLTGTGSAAVAVLVSTHHATCIFVFAYAVKQQLPSKKTHRAHTVRHTRCYRADDRLPSCAVKSSWHCGAMRSHACILLVQHEAMWAPANEHTERCTQHMQDPSGFTASNTTQSTHNRLLSDVAACYLALCRQRPY